MIHDVFIILEETQRKIQILVPSERCPPSSCAKYEQNFNIPNKINTPLYLKYCTSQPVGRAMFLSHEKWGAVRILPSGTREAKWKCHNGEQKQKQELLKPNRFFILLISTKVHKDVCDQSGEVTVHSTCIMGQTPLTGEPKRKARFGLFLRLKGCSWIGQNSQGSSQCNKSVFNSCQQTDK